MREHLGNGWLWPEYGCDVNLAKVSASYALGRVSARCCGKVWETRLCWLSPVIAHVLVSRADIQRS